MSTKPKRNPLPGVFLFLFLVLMTSLTMFLSQRPLSPLPASIPASEFSAERAFRHVEALANEPHPVGTAAHQQVLNYVVSDLTIEAASMGKIRAIVRNYEYGLPQIPGFRYDMRPPDRMPLAREFLPKNRTDTVLVSKTFAFGQQE